MTATAEMINDLRQHEALCEELLAVVTSENGGRRGSDPIPAAETLRAKRELLPRLDQSVDRLRAHRLHWRGLDPAERARHPEVAALLRQNQDLIMKIIVLDRENEQGLLRSGLVPARQLPSAIRQRPHFVADLYRRNSAP